MPKIREALQSPRWRFFVLLTAILTVAAALRCVQLGRSSFWYDEVVTMRLARASGPSGLVELLGRIDATRAPLHPLLLQGWVSVFGPSELSARSFSALCGVLTVAAACRVGSLAFGAATGLWAAWLCAVSPLLIYYAREARMYSWLVLVTCLAWGELFSRERSPRAGNLVFYGTALVALVYSHPLGLAMAGLIGAASLWHRRAFHFALRDWLITHLGVLAAVAPWLGRYLDHAPESFSGPLSFRFLLGMPIGFIGGNFATSMVAAALVALGLFAVGRRDGERLRIALDRPAFTLSLLLWLMVPPLALYAYSHLAWPIFGPARYTLFVAPAYLVLAARGLAKLSWPLAGSLALAGAVLSGAMLKNDVYLPGLKADWKQAAAYLDRAAPGTAVAVLEAPGAHNPTYETARYYFGRDRPIIQWSGRPEDWPEGRSSLWLAIGLRNGRPTRSLSGSPHRLESFDFPGLRLVRARRAEPIRSKTEGPRSQGPDANAARPRP